MNPQTVTNIAGQTKMLPCNQIHRYSRSFGTTTFMWVFSGLILAAPAQSPLLSPTQTADPCVNQWRASRGITTHELPDQAVSKLFDLISPKASAPEAWKANCTWTNVVLDKIRTDAGEYTTGMAVIAIGNDQHALTDSAPFEIDGDRFKVSGQRVGLSGVLTENSFSGTIGIDKQEAKISAFSFAPSYTQFKGVVPDSIGNSHSNAPITFSLNLESKGTSMGNYLDEKINYGINGVGHGGTHAEFVPDSWWSDVFCKWAIGITTGSSGILLIGASPNPEIQVYVDNDHVRDLPTSRAVAANTPHTVEARRGKIVKSQKIILAINETLLWPVPAI